MAWGRGRPTIGGWKGPGHGRRDIRWPRAARTRERLAARGTAGGDRRPCRNRPTAFGLNAAEDAQAKKHKKKGKKKKPYNPSGAYNTCLAEVSLLCGMAGCASREQSPGCAACYADVEACCQQALIAKGADCACINTLPGFVCFGG